MLLKFIKLSFCGADCHAFGVLSVNCCFTDNHAFQEHSVEPCIADIYAFEVHSVELRFADFIMLLKYIQFSSGLQIFMISKNTQLRPMFQISSHLKYI